MSNKESVGKREHMFLMAENKELRKLWIENEGDIISLKSTMQRYFALPWYKRLFIKWTDWQLHKDVRPESKENTNG